jgi:hypothetical protein
VSSSSSFEGAVAAVFSDVKKVDGLVAYCRIFDKISKALPMVQEIVAGNKSIQEEVTNTKCSQVLEMNVGNRHR